ncbi:hypothetical protein V6N13_014517 [Hibiscus sabdariffa]
MVQLKTMSVTDCKMIEEIMASTTDEVTDVVVFNQLESLELDSLPCLSRFCSVNYPLVCPKMEFFTMGELSTPMLYALQSTNGEEIELREGDLNATIQQLFIKKTNGIHVRYRLFTLKSSSSRIHIHTNERASLKDVQIQIQVLSRCSTVPILPWYTLSWRCSCFV